MKFLIVRMKDSGALKPLRIYENMDEVVDLVSEEEKEFGFWYNGEEYHEFEEFMFPFVDDGNFYPFPMEGSIKESFVERNDYRYAEIMDVREGENEFEVLTYDERFPAQQDFTYGFLAANGTPYYASYYTIYDLEGYLEYKFGCEDIADLYRLGFVSFDTVYCGDDNLSRMRIEPVISYHLTDEQVKFIKSSIIYWRSEGLRKDVEKHS